VRILNVSRVNVRADVQPVSSNRVEIEIIRPKRPETSLDKAQVKATSAGIERDKGFSLGADWGETTGQG
jgi:hypothetical protein